MYYNTTHWQSISFQTETRYYQICLQQDLLGDWIVQRSWGGLHNRIHGSKQHAYPSLELAEKQLALLIKERHRKKYQQH